MRNLKILGLALVAMLAMSAVGASMASADDLTSEVVGAVQLHGTNEPAEPDSFVTTAGTVTCQEVTYNIGTISVPATSVTATPVYETLAKNGTHNCKFLGLPATIHTEGCDFVFTVTGGTSTVGDAAVKCPAGKAITVTAISAGTLKCSVSVSEQTLSSAAEPDPVTGVNIGAGTTREVTLKVSYKGLKYTHTAGTGLGACTSGSGTGTFNGKGVVTAQNDAKTARVGLFLSNV
jgi:hypothetical protein